MVSHNDVSADVHPRPEAAAEQTATDSGTQSEMVKDVRRNDSPWAGEIIGAFWAMGQGSLGWRIEDARPLLQTICDWQRRASRLIAERTEGPEPSNPLSRLASDAALRRAANRATKKNLATSRGNYSCNFTADRSPCPTTDEPRRLRRCLDGGIPGRCRTQWTCPPRP